jgi:1-acyl-sn-glycerol-3-phosphate acyltransferase
MEGAERQSQRGRFLAWLKGRASQGWGTRIDDFDPEAVADTVHRLRHLFGSEWSYFPLEVEGLENLPDGPVLLVANHSGGTTIPDAWGLMVTWYRHFGQKRPVHALAHEMVFALQQTAEPFAKRGVLRAERDIALRVLTEWKRDVVVWPGGDLDTWRPYSERYKVRFSGRTGYARLALKAGVPIVPIAHAGSHETLVVLTDGQRVARRLHLPELFRASIFPVHLSLPFGLGIGPTPHLPTPARLRYRFAPPIYPTEEVAPGEEPSTEAILAMDAAVRNAMQSELDTLRDTAPPRAQRLRRLVNHLVRAVA